MGGPRPLLEIFYKEPSRLLVKLRDSAGSLSRLQGTAFVELLAVAFDCRTIDSETAGSLCLGHALLNRLDDLLSEVQRLSTHASTIPGAPPSQSAVTPSTGFHVCSLHHRQSRTHPRDEFPIVLALGHALRPEEMLSSPYPLSCFPQVIHGFF
jgi:hypothetical protein